jgi:hypothetical protein
MILLANSRHPKRPALALKSSTEVSYLSSFLTPPTGWEYIYDLHLLWLWPKKQVYIVYVKSTSSIAKLQLK